MTLEIDGYEDPPIAPDPSWYEWIIVAVIAAVIVASVIAVHAGETEKPTLWIYTSAEFKPTLGKWRSSYCNPCNNFERDVEAGRLSGFNIVRLKPPPSCSVPYLYWKGSNGEWCSQLGWARTQLFMEKWRRDVK